MKVDGISPSSIITVKAINRIEQINGKTPSLGTDEVAVSDKAQIYQNLLLKAKGVPAVREEKVRELSERLANGQFNFDARKLANRLLDGSMI
ncbi:MAG: flagellar biosynthesis anti-sigma factor FlgM [Desulfitobacteriaceae bacterium]